MLELPILSITMLLPLFSALYIMFFTSNTRSLNVQSYAIYVAILSSSITFILIIYLLFSFDSTNPLYQFVEHYSWIQKIGLEFYIGIDSISLVFISLTAFLTLVSIISSIFTIKKHIQAFLFCFLLIESFSIGAFVSMNLLLFYLFFEIILIPMYIIIGVWGGENRLYASIKFFLYSFFGSVFLLLSLIYIYTQTHSFNMLELSELMSALALARQQILWWGIFIAFAVKIPMFPFHTWLPDAHVQAPTAGSVILAGILLKLGAYGFLRISLPMLPGPSQEFAIYVLILSTFAVIYASLVALAQTDIKKMIAYSSIAHMGYVTAGIFSLTDQGIKGSIFQMISHGLISSSLFLIIGTLYERHHTKEIAQYGGVARKMPILATFFMITMLGSISLPATSGFIGEFLSLLGIFKVNIVMSFIIASGIILGAVYMLKLYKEVMLGRITNKKILNFQDLHSYEIISIAPLCVLIIYLGLLPNIIINMLDLSVSKLVMI